MQQEVNYFLCNICKLEIPEQFKFFEHLKTHYEHSAEVLINEEGQETQVIVSLHSDESTEQLAIPETLDPLPIYIDGKGKGGKGKKGRIEVVCDNGEPVEKILLTCPKCRRTFRREKTYVAHLSTCQQMSDEGIEDDAEKYPPLVLAKKSKVKPELMVTEQQISDGIIEIHQLGDTVMTATLEDLEPIDTKEGIFEESEVFLPEDIEEEDPFTDNRQCIACGENFPTKAKLEAHLKKLHPEVAANGAKGKKKRQTGQRRQEVLKCTECHRIFNHRNSLVYHMRSHTGERPHQCEMCGKSFFATSALKVHMRLHSGEKPYKCEHCGRHFRQWGDLKYHVISIHSDIRQYQCEFCGKDFARKYSLIVHRRIHTGERNYKCEFCGKCFRAASYLQNHRRIHTGEKPHSCTICGKPFRVRSDMKRHMASHNRDHSHTGHANNSHAQQTQTITVATTTANITIQEENEVDGLSGPDQVRVITIGPQISHLVRAGQAIQVQGSSGDLDHQQQITIEDPTEEVISSDLSEGTPINITLTQDGRTTTTSLEAATVATLQSADIPDGVFQIPNREGGVETVTLRDSNTGTLYVWPVFMN